MTSALPPRRPRPVASPDPAATRPSPSPRAADEAALQARIDAFFAGGEEDEGPARGTMASRLRLDARLRQRVCISAIGAGVALFVVASLTTSLAGADTAARHAAVSHAPTSPLIILPTTDTTPASSAVRKTAPRTPAHVARQASTDRRAGSGRSANGAPAAVRAAAPGSVIAAPKRAAGPSASAAPATPSKPSSGSTRTSGGGRAGGGSGAAGGSSSSSSSAPTSPPSSHPSPSGTPTASPTPTCHLTIGGLCL